MEEANAFVVNDVKTGFLWGYPVSTKSADEVSESLRHFIGRRKLVTLYSDNAREIISAAKDLAEQHETSFVGLPQNNAIAERTNQVIIGGTCALLVQSGLPACFWSYAIECFSANYNAAGGGLDQQSP